MKMPVRILLILLCAAMIIALPFTISAPNMLNDVKMELMNDADDDEEIDFGRLFFSAACAEKAEEVFEDEDLDTGEVSGEKKAPRTFLTETLTLPKERDAKKAITKNMISPVTSRILLSPFFLSVFIQ